jgi:hypothetical protein
MPSDRGWCIFVVWVVICEALLFQYHDLHLFSIQRPTPQSFLNLTKETQKPSNERIVIRAPDTPHIQAMVPKRDLSETWITECRHHLCNPHQEPAKVYTCDASKREWKLTFCSPICPIENSDELEQENRPLQHSHPSWFGSIERGLKLVGSPQGSWNINPSHPRLMGNVIWTDSCNEVRNQLASTNYFERYNRTGFIICGTVGLTFENIQDLSDDRVGFFIAPSTWVYDGLRGNKSLNHVESARVRVLVSGVDAELWKPEQQDYVYRSSGAVPKVLIYIKNFKDDSIIKRTTALLTQRGCEVVQVVYGSYGMESFRQYL